MGSKGPIKSSTSSSGKGIVNKQNEERRNTEEKENIDSLVLHRRP
jgi:hypothetical protein